MTSSRGLADMYLEGRSTPWLVPELVAGRSRTRGRPPFREVLTHGFLIDVDGRKMSKSLGNTILPQEVIKESGANTQAVGGDERLPEELRVQADPAADRRSLPQDPEHRPIPAGQPLRLRSIAPGTGDGDAGGGSACLARYADAATEILDAYDAFDFPTIFQRINQLTTVDLSAFYAAVSKDRLYTFAASTDAAPRRRRCT